MKEERVCVLCGKIFIATNPRRTRCYEDHYVNCCICGKPVIKNYGNTRDQVTCSAKCKRAKCSDKIKKTNLERYGSENCWGDKEIRKKSEQTMLEKYGAKCTSQSKELQEKCKQTMIERYGVDCTWKSSELMKKAKKTIEIKYGGHCFTVGSKMREKYLKTMSEKDEIQINKVSKINLKVKKFLQDNGIMSKAEKPLEMFWYDLVIESLKILIEVNPTVTHNSHFSPFGSFEGKDPRYHYEKTKLAMQNGYLCIHIWNWTNWNEVVEQIKHINEYNVRQEEPVKVWSDVNSGKIILDSELEETEEEMLKKHWYPVFTDGAIWEKQT